MTGSTAPVRDIGTVKDVHGYVIRVGVDHDSVTIGGAAYAMLGPDVIDDFMKLLMQADTEAKAYAEAKRRCNACAGPSSCSEFGRCVLEAAESECLFCGERIRLLGDHWTTDDGTIACMDPSAPFVPHKPKGSWRRGCCSDDCC